MSSSVSDTPNWLSSPPVDHTVAIVHQVTGTYLQVQNESDNTLNALLQNEHHWPLPANKTLQWRLRRVPSKGSSDAYLLLNEAHEHAITMTTVDSTQIPTVSPKLTPVEGKNGSMQQQWTVRHVPGTGGAYWALSPWADDGYALAPKNNYLNNDQYIVPTPTWGGPYSLFQAWSIFPYPGTE